MKLHNSIDDLIDRDFVKKPVQAYISKVVQVSHLLEWMIDVLGGEAKIWHSTFSVSEEFIRSIISLRKKTSLSEYTLIVDRKGLAKILPLVKFISSAVDSAFIADNHSKVIVAQNRTGQLLAAVTSQNLTRGNRYECTMLTSDESVCRSLLNGLIDITKQSNILYHETSLQTTAST